MTLISKERSLKKTHNYNTCKKKEPNIPLAKCQSYHDSFLVKGMAERQKMSKLLKVLWRIQGVTKVTAKGE